MIPIWGTSAVLTAPPAPLLANGFIAGNTFPAQFWNYQWKHLTTELVNVLVAGNIVQNATVDTQQLSAILALAGQGYLPLSAGSPYTLSLSNPLYGTIDVTTGASNYIINLPSAATAFAIGYEADFRKADAGAGKLTLQLANSADYLANVLNGTWDVTEQFGHVKIRAVQVAGVYGYQVQYCDGTVYRNVITTPQTQVAPVQNTWYNKGGSLAIAPGVYELSWSAIVLATAVMQNIGVTLSTGASSESDVDFSATATILSASTLSSGMYRTKRVILTVATTYYLNIVLLTTAGGGNIAFYAGTSYGNIRIEAKRVG